MAKKWYPVVDILSCIKCGTRVNFCSHGVYDKKNASTPFVVNPDGCIEHCHGCGTKCPVGVITYVGDDTGWIPPALRDKGGMPDAAPNCGCGCGCTAEPETVSNNKKLQIEYLYSAVFSVGTAVTFVALGLIATSAGKLMGTPSPA